LFLFHFWDRVFLTFLGLALSFWSSFLCLLSTLDYRCGDTMPSAPSLIGVYCWIVVLSLMKSTF
jgi:hypothetical protein